MHSSSMRTIRCSGRLMGGVVSAQGGCLPGGCVCRGGCLPRGGVCLGGGGMGVCRGSVCPGGVSARGVSAQMVYTSFPPCGQNSGQTLVKTLHLCTTVIRSSNVHDFHAIIHFKFNSGFSVLLFSFL